MIRITSKQEGFRRAGMSHTKEPKEYPDHQFSPEQLAALKAEPMLIVVIEEKVKEVPLEKTAPASKAAVSGSESVKIARKGRR